MIKNRMLRLMASAGVVIACGVVRFWINEYDPTLQTILHLAWEVALVYFLFTKEE